MHDWSKLNDVKRSVLNQIIFKWENLINDTKSTEHDVHQFISDHASLFFDNPDAPVVSRLKLGDDYITDLVVMRDNESYGFLYELIELESPNDKMFTSKGIQTSALTEALQQIEDWKRWIGDNLSKAKEIFPSKAFHSTHKPQLKYTIIIGRRDEVLLNNEKRLQKSHDYGVEIRSYDYLTSRIKNLKVVNFPCFEVPINDWENDISEEELNILISPFRKCLPYARWKRIVKSKKFYTSHMAGWNWKNFISNTPINEDVLHEFENAL
ncbi:Shedu anti-phage system protein SduA domain-containing protein [Gynuella sp.]|uniref:Shedu anti-phage system protein SduA domain-containing protein n=1 Tax=Gynuella sp. TaxID=2969146 RepID=UPI003D0B9551